MATEPAADSCLGCRGPLQSLGVEHFRGGGVSGGWAALMGQWAEIGEGILDIELLACRNCRRVEVRVPQQREPARAWAVPGLPPPQVNPGCLPPRLSLLGL